MDTVLKEIRLKNWKSFEDATLYIDPFTVLIGTNASGKSNILDALVFLQRIADGLDVQTALGGNESLPALRGGVNGAVYNSGENFEVSIVQDVCLTNPDNKFHKAELEITHIIKVFIKKLETIKDCFSLLEIDKDFIKDKKYITDSLGVTEKIFLNKDVLDKKIATMNSGRFFKNDDPYFLMCLYNKLLDIQRVFEYWPDQIFFVLEVKPEKIRTYSRYSQNLLPDASNLAGFLITLPEIIQKDIEQTLTEYLSQLPEKDIKRVWAEPVGRLGNDAMLYCEEEWIDGQTQIIDAHSMSDGTLRFLAILTALLTRPEGSLLAIEEVDNGLHPSRMHLLLKAIREIGARRNLDVLVTTHNPALLDNLPPEMMPFVQVVHRDMHTGASKITPLDDIEQLPKLLASGSLGKITSRGELEQSLQAQDAKHG